MSETIDVFLCTVPTLGRSEWLRECSNYWLAQPGVRLHVLSPKNILCSEYDFQSRRRVFADCVAATDPYIVTDDDCLPDGHIVERGVAILRRYPQFRVLTPLPSNCTINPWTPPQEENYEPFRDEEVDEHFSVGGVRFVRKNVLRHWPPQDRRGYDQEQCQQIRKEGGRVGFFRDLRYEHLGEGASTVWGR